MDDEESARERNLDEAIEESFPASDPPANTVETGTHVGATGVMELAAKVFDHKAAHQFELEVEGQTSVLTYQRNADSLVLLHTEVPPSLRGRHIADTLAKAALDAADAEGLHAIPVCPFVKAYLKRHPRVVSR
jgi:predicted GNAT family acetyltransferase